jgi:hypothetical protein
VLESLLCQLSSEGQVHLPAPEFFNQRIVISRVNHHQYGREILGRGPYHGGAANIYILQRIFYGYAWFGHGFNKGIQVHHYHIDGLDLVLQFIHMPRLVTPRQYATMHHRVQRLNAAVQYLGKSRDI